MNMASLRHLTATNTIDQQDSVLVPASVLAAKRRERDERRKMVGSSIVGQAIAEQEASAP